MASFVRTAHGLSRKLGNVVEVLVPPADELSHPLAAILPVPASPPERGKDGRISGSAAAKALGRRGGQAKARRVRLVDSLGLAKIAEDSTFRPYRDAALQFVKHHLA